MNFLIVSSAPSRRITAAISDTVPPAAPSGLAVTANTSSSLSGTIDLHGDADADLTEIVVIWGETNPVTVANQAGEVSLGPTATTWDTGSVLDPDTEYFVAAYAVDSAGNDSALSNQDSETTEAAITAPDAPTSLTATPNGVGVNALVWVDNAADEDGQEIHRSTSSSFTPGPSTLLATLAADLEAYSDTAANPGTTYFYKVRAFNSGGTADSNEDSAVTQSGGVQPFHSETFAGGVTHNGGGFTWSSSSNPDVMSDGITATSPTGTNFALAASYPAKAPCASSQSIEKRFQLKAAGSGGYTQNWFDWWMYYPDGTEVRRTYTGGAMTAASAVLTLTSANAHDRDVGDKITVPGAGAAGADLVTTIASFQNTGQVTLATVALTNVSGKACPVVAHAYFARFPGKIVNGICEPTNESVASNTKFLVLWDENYATNHISFGVETRAIDTESGGGITVDAQGDSYVKVLWDAHYDESGNQICLIENFVDDADALAIPRGEWTRVRMYFKLASAVGVADGAYKCWIGDTLVANTTHRAAADVGFNNYLRWGYVYGASNAGFTNRTHVYIGKMDVYNQDPGW